MAKYIDADRLRAEIEKTYKSEIAPWLSGVSATSAIYDYVLPLIDSLPQERPEIPKIERADYYYHEGVCKGFSQGSAEALKILEEFMKRKADPVIVIKQQEQPEVDLKEEIAAFFSKNPIPHEHITDWPLLKNTALHFFNLGLNARKKD